MKKIICSVLLIATMALLLCSCGKFTCDLCGKEKRGKRHEKTLLGQGIIICDDCQSSIDGLLGK